MRITLVVLAAIAFATLIVLFRATSGSIEKARISEVQTREFDEPGVDLTAVSAEAVAKEVVTAQGETVAAKKIAEVRVGRQVAEIVSVKNSLRQTRQSAQEMDFSSYHQQIIESDSISGELALTAYYFTKSCIGQPRTIDAMDLRLEQTENFYQQQVSENSAAAYESQLSRLESEFDRCAGLDDYDLVATAVDWLQIAADVGYLPAQVAFYTELPDLLRKTRDRLFREPGYIDLHREKSIEYLQLAVNTGHRDAYAQMATAILDGVLYEADPMMALAYLYAANRGGTSTATASERQTQIELELTASDVLLSQRRADEICRQYGCRNQAPTTTSSNGEDNG